MLLFPVYPCAPRTAVRLRRDGRCKPAAEYFAAAWESAPRAVRCMHAQNPMVKRKRQGVVNTITGDTSSYVGCLPRPTPRCTCTAMSGIGLSRRGADSRLFGLGTLNGGTLALRGCSLSSSACQL